MGALPEVEIWQGKLRGSVASSFLGEQYYSFQGIPYAKKPIGELRFKAPQPPEKWSGIFDATKEGSASIGRDMLHADIRITGSENCLILNVYTKHLDSKSRLPVLFWIHGGGFIWGSSTTNEFSPDFLLTEDVVVVTINYRLGLLGFLSLKDASLDIPGNAGMKDMVMALKWVKNNIEKFGGDPENVTIFGQSAGGASVQYLQLSPLARGLFHKAIAQSGSVFNPWALGIQSSEKIAEAAGLTNVTEKELLQYLLEQPAEQILEIQEKIPDLIITFDRERIFAPVVEANASSDSFLPESPNKILLSGKINQVPLMTGFTDAEGICFDFLTKISSKGHFGKFLAEVDLKSFEKNVPWTLGYKAGSKEKREVAQKIKTFYYGNEEPTPENNSTRIIVDTDIAFLEGIYRTVEKHKLLSKFPIYFYRVSIETSLNYFKKLAGVQGPGASHCDELGHLFKNFVTPQITPGSAEDVAWRRFVKLWTNFAKYGNPTPDANDPLLNVIWKPVQKDAINFLQIGDNLAMDVNPEPKRIAFWKALVANSPGGNL